MTSTDVSSLALIRQFIVEYTDAAPTDISLDADLVSLGVDSLTLAEMLFALEDKLGVTMAEPTDRPKRVADLVSLIEPYADEIRALTVAA